LGHLSESLRVLVPRINNPRVSANLQRYCATLSPFCAANGRTWGNSQLPGGVNVANDDNWNRPDLVSDQAPNSAGIAYPAGTPNDQQLVVDSGVGVSLGDTQFLVFDTGLPFNNNIFDGSRAYNYTVNKYLPPVTFAGAPNFANFTRIGHSVRSNFLFHQRAYRV